jgi:hypothetical protein
MRLNDRLHWKRVYYVNGPTKGGEGVGLPSRGEGISQGPRRILRNTLRERRN